MSIIKILGVLILVISFSIGAQGASINGEAISDFYEEIFTPERLEEGLCGAVFMVVQDGEIVFLDGYGLANREENIGVNPEETRFRIGSVSKLFTSTALMQLVEDGRVGLHEDIREYLPWLEDKLDYSEPITSWHLLTHTAGLDERAIGMASEDYREVIPLEEFVRGSLPPQVRPPGVLPQYSNHGMALAALVVESVTGMGFDSYLREEIFIPLGMENSSPRLLTEDLPHIAREYLFTGEEHIPRPLYDFNFPPVGSIVSTAPDMAQFMVAFLDGGNEFLSMEITQKKLEKEFYLHPRMPGIGLGFFELEFRDHTLIGHGGDTLGSHSFLLLEPEGNTGFFISSTGSAGPLLIRDVIEGISRTFYGEWADGKPEIMSTPVDNEHLLGSYRVNRFSQTDIYRLMTLIQPNPRIVDGGNGKLKMVTPERENILHPVEKDLYVNLDQGYYVFFGENEINGRGFMQFNFPIIVYEKLSWYENNQFHLILAGVSLVILLAGVIFFGLLPLIRRRRKNPLPIIFYLGGMVSVLQITWVVVVAVTIALLGDFMYLGFGLPPAFSVARVLFFGANFLTVLCVIGLFFIFSRKKGSGLQRLIYTSVTGASLIFSLVFWLYRFPFF